MEIFNKRWLNGQSHPAALKILLASKAVMLAFAFPVYAQETDTQKMGNQGGLEEIVVTARKRTENLQSVPVAVTVVSAATIEERDIRALTDINRYTPGLTLLEGSNVNGGSISTAAFIRGVGQRLAQFVADPAVGLYIDGVYMGRVVGSVMSVVDAKRVEVLRGPQGTLYGKNTLGGAINVTSHMPSGEFGGYIDLGYEDKYQGRDARGAINLPLVEDKLAARINVSSMRHDGYDPNPITGFDAGSLDSSAARAVLRYTPTDRFTATVLADISSYDNTMQGTQITRVTPGGALDTFVPGGAEQYVDGEHLSYIEAINNIGGPTNDLDAWGVAANLDWELAPRVTLTSITGYRDMDSHVVADADGTPALYNQNEIFGHMDQFSEELRLNGTLFNDSLTWQMGVYYAAETIQDLNYITRNADGDFIRQQIDGDTTSWAFFTENTLHLSDTLSITAGVRYSDEKKDTFAQSHDFMANVERFPAKRAENSWDSVTPRVSLEYSQTENFLIYTSYAEGFKSGGLNYILIFPEDLAPFDPERTETWEAGLKSELFNGRLRTNVAAFHTAYSDVQFESFFGGPVGGVVCKGLPFCSRTLNAAAAKIEGVELEIQAAPTEGLDLFANVAYMRNEITEIDPIVEALGAIAFDTELSRTPEWTATVGGSYRYRVRDAGEIVLRADYAFQDHIYFDMSNTEGADQDDYGLVNAGIAFETSNGRWRFAIDGQNLTDEIYAVSGTGSTIGPDGYTFEFYGAPRTVTFSARYRFGGNNPIDP